MAREDTTVKSKKPNTWEPAGIWVRGFALALDLAILAGLVLMLLVFSCTSTQKEDLNAISPPLSPAEEQATFQLEPGFKIQLVAAEPMVQEPVSIQFDEDGRMWVIEMRGYMVDIEGTFPT